MVRSRGGHAPRSSNTVTKIIVMLTTTVGSALGWWLGARLGIMTAFVLSMIGFGVGMWAGRKLALRLEL